MENRNIDSDDSDKLVNFTKIDLDLDLDDSLQDESNKLESNVNAAFDIDNDVTNCDVTGRDDDVTRSCVIFVPASAPSDDGAGKDWKAASERSGFVTGGDAGGNAGSSKRGGKKVEEDLTRSVVVDSLDLSPEMDETCAELELTDTEAATTSSCCSVCSNCVRTKTCRLSSMLVLTFLFFLAELVFGHVTHSLALVGDAYHMLSDVIALCIAMASVRISKLESRKNTYGWARAEVLGALVNAVFLIALCFTIFVEAIEKLSSDEKIEHVDWLLYVGITGLVINIIGLVLFHGDTHGHSHGGGSGGHGGHGHSHGHGHGKIHQELEDTDNNADDADKPETELSAGSSNPSSIDNSELESSGVSSATGSGTSPDVEVEVEEYSSTAHSGSEKRRNKTHSSAQLNMRGVFLHVLGDALGSIVVIISALVIKFTDVHWKYKVDPAMSIIIVLIILSTTIPLLRESAFILLQTVPTHIRVHELKTKLISKVDGVVAVHEFHVWQLAGNRIVASAHIRCANQTDYMRIAEQVKSFFHNEGIHSTTIQPEFAQCDEISPAGRDCVLECGPDKSCYVDTCCAKRKHFKKFGRPQQLKQSENISHSRSTVNTPEGLSHCAT